MMTPTVYILIGPPASGKSTWRETFLSKSAYPTTVVSTDDLIEEYARENALNYNDAFFQVNFSDIEKKMFSNLREAISRTDNIIVDRTSMRAKFRRRVLSNIPKTYKKVAVVFDIATPILLSRLHIRAAETGKMIPVKSVMEMIETYQEPTLEEFDSIIIEKQEA